MRFNLIVLALVFSMLFVMSAPPLGITGGDLERGIIIFHPTNPYLIANESYKLHIHAENVSNGFIFNNVEVDCFVHLYGRQGGHIYESMSPMNKEANGIDHEVEFTQGNFSNLGFHQFTTWCNNTAQDVSGEESHGFYVTTTGEEQDGDVMKTVFAILFILLFAGMLIILINTIAKFARLEFTLYDMAFSMSLYIGLVAFRFISFIYLSSVELNGFLDSIVGWLAWPMVVLPGLALLVTIVAQFKDQNIKALDWKQTGVREVEPLG